MPEMLILVEPEFSGDEFAKLAQSKGFRVKTASSKKDALSWLRMREINCCLVPMTTEVEVQQELAGALWDKTPSAPFVIYASEDSSQDQRSSARLNGAEVLLGEYALKRLDSLLDSILRAKAFSKMSVMVVEDLESPRDIICAYIENMGDYYVEGKASAKEAMQELEANPEKFSCILTDIRMPEIDGKELLAYIRKHAAFQHLPVIVLTAYGTMDTLVDCLKAGATGFLAKPPKKGDVLRELARAQRVIQGLASPRLATHEEAEMLREVLIDRGFY